MPDPLNFYSLSFIDRGQERGYRGLYYDTILSYIEDVHDPERGKGGSMASREVILSVNAAPIALNDFVQGYIDNVVCAILASLRGSAEIESIELSIEGDDVSIVLNNAAVPLNPFVTRIIRSTMLGVISSLKGVSIIEGMRVNIKKEDKRS